MCGFLPFSEFQRTRRRNMLIGYAHVSTEDQNLDLQRDALTAAGSDFAGAITGTYPQRSRLVPSTRAGRSGGATDVAGPMRGNDSPAMHRNG